MKKSPIAQKEKVIKAGTINRPGILSRFVILDLQSRAQITIVRVIGRLVLFNL